MCLENVLTTYMSEWLKKFLSVTVPFLTIVSGLVIGQQLQDWIGLQVYECTRWLPGLLRHRLEWEKQEKTLKKFPSFSKKFRILTIWLMLFTFSMGCTESLKPGEDPWALSSPSNSPICVKIKLQYPNENALEVHPQEIRSENCFPFSTVLFYWKYFYSALMLYVSDQIFLFM